uniref:C2H2-type domain-containing protein n=1 Tax=Chromera velia CCMP2878 TaxID=1169474 RepID=A0A0G4HHN0_9ALVE|eukprot:Cvel_27550.t1-p1 / transcript=Cvel_27550.t1 / gene=Cvel_27550 / organism=Chromera_velia_CCMP2878 / gene_product=tRNA 2-thiocytidine biosynthesis protein TtcA, putative / transcript_product=tRNA 2-thiocytidine biosynthesis protein TtcA, putative / location=Cvel_scaffold3459:5833-16909(+) / protein_length=1105 / sequence_SO=supercontig / SO=protein_coding / is_pseudo=false
MERYIFNEAAERPQEGGPGGSGRDGDGERAPRDIAALATDIIGGEASIVTPYGAKRVVYADFTASGRSLRSIEGFILQRVLPLYGNTHSLTTATARQSTFFKNEARHIAKAFFNATHEDALIFCGYGCTAAIHKFVEVLNNNFWGFREENDDGEDEEWEREKEKGKGKGKGMFVEDRWGSCECSLCGIRVKNEQLFRAHLRSELHLKREAERDREGNKEKETAERAGGVSKKKKKTNAIKVVLFLLDPTAHHSLSLPFRELCASSGGRPSRRGAPLSLLFSHQALPLDPSTGLADLDALSGRLEAVRKLEKEGGRLSILPVCVLSAASNVTGLCLDFHEAAERAHAKGAVAVFDFASWAGHGRIDLNPPERPQAAADAAFLSPHKFLGGPGSAGVLVMKKKLMSSTAPPAVAGGGTVFFVSEGGHSYIRNLEEREEAGTPDVPAAARAGLVFRLHNGLEREAVSAREEKLFRLMTEGWADDPRICVLGSFPSVWPPEKRTNEEGKNNGTGIVSFMVSWEKPQDGASASSGKTREETSKRTKAPLFLHYHFVVALLNDLFGIQARGGCACAGPYGQWLLGIGPEMSASFEEMLESTGQEVLRPGFVRLGVHFSMSEEETREINKAVLFVAEHGWRFLPHYTFVTETGEWKHRHYKPETERAWLSDLPVSGTPLEAPFPPLGGTPGDGSGPKHATVDEAKTVLESLYGDGQAMQLLKSPRMPPLPSEISDLMWFVTPADAAVSLLAGRPSSASVRSLTGREILSATPRPAPWEALIPFPGSGTKAVSQERCGCFRVRNFSEAASVGGDPSDLLAGLSGSPFSEFEEEMREVVRVASAVAVEVDRGLMTPSPPVSQRESAQGSSSEVAAQLRGGVGQKREREEIEENEKGRGATEEGGSKKGGTETVPPPESKKAKRAKDGKGPEVPKSLRRTVGNAIKEFDMIREGDKILVGLSGGKDSLTLLHCLRELQKRAPVKFSVAAATVDPQTPEYNPRPLISYCESLGVPYHFLSYPLIEMAKTRLQGTSICAFCSRMKRGMLYSCMRKFGYSVLALGQHLDDVAESFVMSAFHNGQLNTMKAHYRIGKGDLRGEGSCGLRQECRAARDSG